MTYEEVVKEAQKIVAKGDASGIKDHLAVQYNITGEGEGAFYMEVKDGQIDVQPYDFKDRDILVTADAQTILDIMVALVYLVILFIYSPLLTMTGVVILSVNLIIVYLRCRYSR